MPSATSKQPKKQILLAVPEDLLQKLDYSASVLHLNRTALILRSLNRDLETTLRHEVFKTKLNNEAMEKEFGSW